jgi:hypothetical protein
MYSFYMDIKKIFRYLMISLNWKRIGFGQVEPRLHPDLIRGPKGPLGDLRSPRDAKRSILWECYYYLWCINIFFL